MVGELPFFHQLLAFKAEEQRLLHGDLSSRPWHSPQRAGVRCRESEVNGQGVALTGNTLLNAVDIRKSGSDR